MNTLCILLVIILVFLLLRRPRLGYHSWSRSRLFGPVYAPVESFCGCDSNGSQCNNNGNLINNVEGFTPKRGGCACQSSIPSPFL